MKPSDSAPAVQAAAKVTAADIRVALKAMYPAPAWRILDEVGNAAGHRVTNWIDCVAVGIWPSVGQELVGIEIKISKADFKRELEKPEKTEAMMKYMDRFYLACPAGLIMADAVPLSWGVIHVRDGKCRIAKQAPRLQPVALDRGLLSAILRRAGETDDGVINAAVSKALSEKRRDEQERIDREVRWHKDQLAATGRDAADKLARIYKWAGIEMTHWVDDEALGRAVGMVYRSGIVNTHGALASACAQAETAARAIRDALASFSADGGEVNR